MVAMQRSDHESWLVLRAQVEKNERNFKLALLGAAAWEILLLIAFLLGMERGNRLHILMLIATVGSYTVIVLGLVTLGVYLNGGNLRLLKAVELLKSDLSARN
jgi:hypothetical protein